MVAITVVIAAAVALTGPRPAVPQAGVSIGPPTSGSAAAVATPRPPLSQASSPREVTPAPDTGLPFELRLGPARGKVVWAIAYPQKRLFVSHNGGGSWEPRSLPPADVLLNPQITFVSDHEGWLLPGGSSATQCTEEDVTIWHTADAGTTWTSLGSTGIADAQCKQGLSFVDAAHGFLSAYDPNHRPLIYRTLDGGRSWVASAPLPDPPDQASQPGGFTLAPWKVAREGGDLLVGATGFGRAYVYRSRDGGATWSWAATVTTATDVVRVTFLDASTWWAVGNGQIGEIITRDGGRDWGAAPSTPQTAAAVPPDVTFVDSSTGYATVRGTLARTDDGGQTWAAVRSPGDASPTLTPIGISSRPYGGDAAAPSILFKFGTDPAIRALSWDGSQSGTTGATAAGYIFPSADGRYYVSDSGIYSRSGRRLGDVPWSHKGDVFTWSSNDELCDVTASPLVTGSPLVLQVAGVGQSPRTVATGFGVYGDNATYPVLSCDEHTGLAVVAAMGQGVATGRVWVIQLSSGRALQTFDYSSAAGVMGPDVRASADGTLLSESIRSDSGAWTTTIRRTTDRAVVQVVDNFDTKAFSGDSTLLAGTRMDSPVVLDRSTNSDVWSAAPGTGWYGSFSEPAGTRFVIGDQPSPASQRYDLYLVGPGSVAVLPSDATVFLRP